MKRQMGEEDQESRDKRMRGNAASAKVTTMGQEETKASDEVLCARCSGHLTTDERPEAGYTRCSQQVMERALRRANRSPEVEPGNTCVQEGQGAIPWP